MVMLQIVKEIYHDLNINNMKHNEKLISCPCCDCTNNDNLSEDFIVND